MALDNMPTWFPEAIAWAQHEDKKRSWPWYGRLIHWVLASWRCPACKLGRTKYGIR